ncbi:metal-sulfur cluster assembly factor [Bacillus taeanensis]|uniref:Benzoyl-CoA oxygenase n=1 Tax=Bacillus taeanensis TaxID=273032 RepID=A0A366Y108_9BACI|nr:metal-sulfur cluster assembly factor [Bacillus taeanensis]RBW70104.1 benzoyl-CoA oxygenase [Bacillus taeanensis]
MEKLAEPVYHIEEHYWNILKDVSDPEFPISVVDMGLIYGIKEKGGVVDVTMTYTTTACACMAWIESDIKNRLLQEDNVNDVNITVVWDPPWTVDRMTEEGRQKMKRWGVSSR